jgi:hypothetical protein
MRLRPNEQGRHHAGVVIIFAGTLDDASWLKPARQIYCDSAQPWVSLHGEMPRFAKTSLGA